jgi:hypothetical protein
MLRSLAILAVLLLGTTIYVTIQDQHATEQTPQQTAQQPNSPTTFSKSDKQSQDNTQKPSRNLPSWHRLFTWPDGMTAWAILLTLWAVAWQSNETRKAAQAALTTANAAKTQIKVMRTQARHMEDQTKILRDSVAAAKQAADAAETSAKAAMGVAVPTLVFVSLEFAEQEDSLAIKLRYPAMRVVVKNYGQTPAVLKSYDVKYSCDGILSSNSIEPAYHFEASDVIESGQEYVLDDAV